MIFIERYPLKSCQGCVKLIASKVKSVHIPKMVLIMFL